MSTAVQKLPLPAQRRALDIATEAASGWNVHPLPMCRGPVLRRYPNHLEESIEAIFPFRPDSTGAERTLCDRGWLRGFSLGDTARRLLYKYGMGGIYGRQSEFECAL